MEYFGNNSPFYTEGVFQDEKYHEVKHTDQVLQKYFNNSKDLTKEDKEYLYRVYDMPKIYMEDNPLDASIQELKQKGNGKFIKHHPDYKAPERDSRCCPGYVPCLCTHIGEKGIVSPIYCARPCCGCTRCCFTPFLCLGSWTKDDVDMATILSITLGDDCEKCYSPIMCWNDNEKWFRSFFFCAKKEESKTQTIFPLCCTCICHDDDQCRFESCIFCCKEEKKVDVKYIPPENLDEKYHEHAIKMKAASQEYRYNRYTFYHLIDIDKDMENIGPPQQHISNEDIIETYS
jgi:hypothetical protein